MKALLLVLSGNAEAARDWLRKTYPEAAVEPVSRSELEARDPFERLRLMRRSRPDLLVIVTERLVWQRGQNALFLFGALAGARTVAIIDSGGDVRAATYRRSRTNTVPVASEPARL